MAKKTAAPKRKSKGRRGNKSAAIKAYVADHPNAGPTEIARELRKQRIRITPAYASNIKSKMNGAQEPASGRSNDSANGTTPVEDVKQAGELVIQAVDLVMKAGVKEARALVDMAGRVINKIEEKNK